MKPITLLITPVLLGAALVVSGFEPEGRANEPRDEIQIAHSKSIKVDDGTLRCVAISPDRKVVACCGDQFVHLFDLKSGERFKQLGGHKGAVNAVAFSPDGRLLASAGEDQTIRLWEVETWKPKGVLKKTIEDDRVPATHLAFSPDGKTLASCSSSKTYLVWLWDVEKARWEHIVRTPHRHACLHLAFSPDGKHVAVAGALNSRKAGHASLHEVNMGLRFLSSWEHDGEEPATCVAFSPDGKTVASAGSDNTIRLWDMKAGQVRLKLTGPKGAKGIRAAAYLPAGDRIVSVTFEETVQLWDAAKGRLLATAVGTDKGVRFMALSTDGKTVATCGEDKVIKLWDVPTGAKKPPEGELRRRAMFGAQFAPVTKEVRDRQKLDGDGGVMLEKIFPGTSAADAQCRAGDVILAVGGAKLTGFPMFVEMVARARAGDVLTLDVVRDSVKSEKRVTLKETPREMGDGYDVVYGSVTSHGSRLRTIVTRPKGDGRYPAVMLLQGGTGCFLIDTAVGQPTGFTWIASDLTRHGYVTLRVERPGCGDSEGGPLRDVDFDTELDAYKQALRALKQLDFVDTDNVFLFGHSMGGMMAPLVAVDVPVRGIAFYGTGAGTWFEAVFGQRRRLASLDGTNPAEVDAEVLRQARFWYPLVVEKKTPREILEKAPELRKLGWVTDGKYVGDRHYTFHHQLADKNLSETWTKVAATRLSVGGKATSPRVLAIWGTSDWLVDRASNAWIAEVVNRTRPGNGTFVALDAIDHFFFRAASLEESYQIWRPANGALPGKFNPVILKTLRAWLDETAGRAKKGLEKPSNESRLVPH